MPIVKNLSYMSRGLLDHSPVTASLEIGEGNHLQEWRIGPLWMKLMGEPQAVLMAYGEFVELNLDYAPDGVVWDTLKGFLQGIMIQQVLKLKKQSKEW